MIIKKVKPLFNSIITTMDLYTEQELSVGGIMDASKTLQSVRDYQKVVAVGDSVRNIKVGDIVQINPSRYMVRKYKENSIAEDVTGYNQTISYRFKTVVMDGIKYLLLSDSDIDFIIEEYEEDPPQSDIIVPDNSIIQV